MKRILLFLFMALLLTGCGSETTETVSATVLTEAVTEPTPAPHNGAFRGTFSADLRGRLHLRQQSCEQIRPGLL